MTDNPLRRWRWITLVVFAGVLVFFFQDEIFHPAHVIFSLEGDGIKNTFTYLWQVLYGQGFHFTGMNYPYGEHIVFTDGQPLISLTVAGLHSVFHFSPGVALGIMYYLVIFSFLLALIYTYRILLHFGLHPAAAIAGAVLTVMLSPQLLRVTGHFPLSYCSFLPMLFYWSLRYDEGGERRYIGYIFLLVCCYAFLHPYFLGMGMLWMLAYVAGYLLLVRDTARIKARHAAPYAAAFVAAFVVVQGILLLTDPVKDRPVYPYSELPDKPLQKLCTSSLSPIWQAAKDLKIVHNTNDSWDGAAYLGIAVMIMLLIGIGRWIYLRVRRRRETRTLPPVWIFVAGATLLFAMTIAYLWDIGPLKIILKPLRQFRAPERFSWIFYYIMSVYAAVLLYRICRHWALNGYRAAATGLAAVVLAGWAIDMNGNLLHLRKGNEGDNWKNNFNNFFTDGRQVWKQFLREQGKKPDDFQAILQLPFTDIGSEKIWVGEDISWILTGAWMISIELHLPLMNVMMSRTSWSQTFRQVTVEGGPLAGRKALAELPSGKPVLLIHPHSWGIAPDEQYVFAAADLLGTVRGTDLYALYPARLFRNQQQYRDSLLRMAALQPEEDRVYGAAPQQVCIRHFDNGKAQQALAAGALPYSSAEDSLLLSWPAPQGDSSQYEFAAWARFNPGSWYWCFYTLAFRDASGRELSRTEAWGKYSVDNTPDGWFRIHKFFRLPAGTATVAVHLMRGVEDSYTATDELLIRPATATIISKWPDGTILVNDHVVVIGHGS